MNLRQFDYVLAVAQHRHFETAADSCFIAQSTLSTMISKLEDELEIQIFDRRKKPVEITQEGAEIIRQLKIIQSEVENLEELVKELKGVESGSVRLSCIPTVAPYLLPLFLYDFSKKYPNIKFEIKESTTAEILHQLRSREIDIGIVSSPVDHTNMEEIPLYREPFVYYNTRKKKNSKIALEDVEFDNFWLLKEGHCMADQVIEICKPESQGMNLDSNVVFKAGSIGSLIRFVRGSNGKTFLPFLATLSLSDSDSRYVSYFKNPMPYRTVSLLVHQHFPKKKLLTLLAEEIREKIVFNQTKNIIELIP